MTKSALVEVVTLPAAQLEELIARAVAKALTDRGVSSDRDMLSATKAARLVHVRTGDLLAALANGSLKGRQRGRRWLVTAQAARAWAKARQ